MTLFTARSLYPEQLAGDEPEPLEQIVWSLDNVDELLAQPDFTEARSVAALLMTLRQLKK